MHCELRTSHVERTDWRMMTDLFIVDRNSFDISLKSLTKNGIERFKHDELSCRNHRKKSDNIFDLS